MGSPSTPSEERDDEAAKEGESAESGDASVALTVETQCRELLKQAATAQTMDEMSFAMLFATAAVARLRDKFPKHAGTAELEDELTRLESLSNILEAIDGSLEVAESTQSDEDRSEFILHVARARAHCIALKASGQRHPVLAALKLRLQNLVKNCKADECYRHVQLGLADFEFALAMNANRPTAELTANAKKVIRAYDLFAAIAPHDERLFTGKGLVEILRMYLSFRDVMRGISIDDQVPNIPRAVGKARRVQKALKHNPEIPAPGSVDYLLPLEAFGVKLQKQLRTFIKMHLPETHES